MRFLYERQTRRFYVFLVTACIAQICLLGVCGIFQAQDIRRILVDRELAAASYLLAADVSPEVVAAAWNHREVTEEGVELLNKIGHTKQTYSYLLLLTEQTSLPLILILLCVGLVFAAVILIGAARFFRHREQVYEDAGNCQVRPKSVRHASASRGDGDNLPVVWKH